MDVLLTLVSPLVVDQEDQPQEPVSGNTQTSPCKIDLGNFICCISLRLTLTTFLCLVVMPRQANAWNASSFLFHCAHYPRQHTVGTPVCLLPPWRSQPLLSIYQHRRIQKTLQRNRTSWESSLPCSNRTAQTNSILWVGFVSWIFLCSQSDSLL